MAHRDLIVALAAIAAAGCGGAERTPADTAPATAAPRPATDFAADETSWGKFHSRRFFVTIPLPDGHAWRIDDHKEPWLVATHDATSTKLTLIATQEPELMNRQKCEERLREIGWIPKAPLSTIEREISPNDEGLDAMRWVAIEAGPPLTGHVFFWGASLRRCLLVHASTSVPSAKDEGVLSGRLVVLSERVIRKLASDGSRTTDDATMPRDKAEIRR